MGPFHRSGRRREVLFGDGKDLIQILESCPSVGREEEEEGHKGKEKDGELRCKGKKTPGTLRTGRDGGWWGQAVNMKGHFQAQEHGLSPVGS